MRKRLLYILVVSLLLGFALIGIGVYISSHYAFSREFYVLLLQHIGLAICFPIIIGFVLEAVSRDHILTFVKESVVSMIDNKQKFFRYGLTTVEIGPDEQELRDVMFKETEEATKATFIFLRAGLILRVLVPVFRRVIDKGGCVNIISPEYDGDFVKSVVAGLKTCPKVSREQSLPRIDTDDEIRKRDSEMKLDYEQYLTNPRFQVLKTPLYIPYGCLLLEKQTHGRIEVVAYWFPFVVSKTCGYGPVFRITSGKMLDIVSEDVAIYIRSAHIATFQSVANK